MLLELGWPDFMIVDCPGSHHRLLVSGWRRGSPRPDENPGSGTKSREMAEGVGFELSAPNPK
jgi:hypothetical protein